MRLLLLFIVALCSCAPAVLPGTADERLQGAVVAGAPKPADLAPLLTEDAEVRRGDLAARGREGAALLATLRPAGEVELYRHHDVSLLKLGDGRAVLLQRDASDRVTRAIELPVPVQGDPMPWQGIYYSKAWNLDDEAARLALLKAVWAPNGRYVDGTNDWTGPEGVSQMIGRFRGLVFGTQVNATTGMADAGGGWLTWDWVILSRQGGRTLFFGVDVMHLDEQGQIDFLAGFVNGKRH